jgi:hypothetical protein
MPPKSGIPATFLRNSMARSSCALGGGGFGGTKGNPIRPSAGGRVTRGRCCPQPPQTGGGVREFRGGVSELAAPFRCALRLSSAATHRVQAFSLGSIASSSVVKGTVNIVPHRGVVPPQFFPHKIHPFSKGSVGLQATVRTHSGGV